MRWVQLLHCHLKVVSQVGFYKATLIISLADEAVSVLRREVSRGSNQVTKSGLVSAAIDHAARGIARTVRRLDAIKADLDADAQVHATMLLDKVGVVWLRTSDSNSNSHHSNPHPPPSSSSLVRQHATRHGKVQAKVD